MIFILFVSRWQKAELEIAGLAQQLRVMLQNKITLMFSWFLWEVGLTLGFVNLCFCRAVASYIEEIEFIVELASTLEKSRNNFRYDPNPMAAENFLELSRKI